MDCVDPDSNFEEQKQEDIYKDRILEHYKHPHNFGKLTETEAFKFSESSPICGDKLEFYVKIEDNRIKEVKFEGQGCVISMSTASMLTDKLKGMHLADVKDLTKQDILNMLGLKALLPSRMKCAMLALNAIQRGLKAKGL